MQPATRVLIADDDPGVRSLVHDVVADLGHTPMLATNGAQALELYTRHGADVVVSDWMMPRLDGVQLCRRVRSRPGAPYTYFILLTGLDDDEHRLAGMQAGADDYLSKPFSLSDVEARLIAAERVTALHRQREALLRQARRFAAETDPARVLDELLREAVTLVDGSAGVVTRWDEQQRMLVAACADEPNLASQRLCLGEGASGRAALHRATVVVHRADPDLHDDVLREAGLESAIAVPLIHDGRLVGTLSVGSTDPHKVFGEQDAELLETLASTAAAAVVALEQARLDGVRLAARTAQHELNNQLAVARGYAELLVGSPDLPPHLADMAQAVKHAADAAARTVRELRSLSQIDEQRWSNPGDTTIRLGHGRTRQRLARGLHMNGGSTGGRR